MANSYDVGANAMKGGQSGYQAGITSFYAGSNYGFKVYRVSASSEYGPYTTVPSLVATVQESTGSTYYPDMAFKNAFVHKERLWVALGGALLFQQYLQYHHLHSWHSPRPFSFLLHD